MDKDVKSLLKSIGKIEGVELRDNGRGHIGVYLRGQFVTSVGQTPSDHRWRANVMADLRRAGIQPASTPPKGMREVPITTKPVDIEEIRSRLKAMTETRGARAAFARFLANDMPVLYPKMRHHKSHASAEQTITTFVQGSVLSDWVHELYSVALREWDAIQATKARAAEAEQKAKPEPEPTRDMTHVYPPTEPTEKEEKEEQVAEQKEPEQKEPEPATTGEANGGRAREAYMDALLEILKKDGSATDVSILERLDKLAGI